MHIITTKVYNLNSLLKNATVENTRPKKLKVLFLPIVKKVKALKKVCKI